MYRILQVVLTLALLFGHNTSMAKEKVLIVGERLVQNNPWRSDLVKLQYEIAMEEAKKDHLKAYPKSELKLLTSFDSGPAEGFDLAGREKAYGVLGYYYSSDAFEASRLALHRKIPYLTAVSPIDAVRNSFSFSLASSHSLIENKLNALAQLEDFNNPTIVLTLPTSMANFEYAKIYGHAFNVVETFKGNPVKYWDRLESLIESLSKQKTVNILLAGSPFEQLDLVNILGMGRFASRVKLIAHAQWNYLPQTLAASISKNIKNFYVVSDYFDLNDLRAHKFSVSEPSFEAYSKLKDMLAKKPKFRGHNLNEPIMYALKDMLVFAMRAAENSKSRGEFQHKLSSSEFNGSSGHYKIKNRVSVRKVYLGTWDKTKMKPIKVL